MKKTNSLSNNSKRKAISPNSTKHSGSAPKLNVPILDTNYYKKKYIAGNKITGSKLYSYLPQISNNIMPKLSNKINAGPENPSSTTTNQKDNLIKHEENKH